MIASLAALAVQSVTMPTEPSVYEAIVLRWIHFVAGITWVGLLYFFNLVNIPFVNQLDASLKARVLPPLMSRALWWFRWSSVVTVLVGFRYFQIFVISDARNAGESAAQPLWSFFLIWTVVFALEMGMLMSPVEVFKKGPVLGVAMAVIVAAAAWLYLQMNNHGWEGNRVLAIGIGGGMGWVMMLNVWGIIWRMQKRMIQWTAASATTPMPPQAAKYARVTFLASRLNFALSFPLLFFMGASGHFPIFGR